MIQNINEILLAEKDKESEMAWHHRGERRGLRIIRREIDILQVKMRSELKRQDAGNTTIEDRCETD